jgi:hypothetical protein
VAAAGPSRLNRPGADIFRALEQALGICCDLGDRLGAGQRPPLPRRHAAGDGVDHLAAAQVLEQTLGIYHDIVGRSGEVTALMRGTLHRVSGALALAEGCHQRPWNWPALWPVPGTRLTLWPASASAPRPTVTPRWARSCCGRHWRCSSGSVLPRPRTCSPRWMPSSARDPQGRLRPRYDDVIGNFPFVGPASAADGSPLPLTRAG